MNDLYLRPGLLWDHRDRIPYHLRGTPSQEPLGRRVPDHHPSLAVEDIDREGRLTDDRLEHECRLTELLLPLRVDISIPLIQPSGLGTEIILPVDTLFFHHPP